MSRPDFDALHAAASGERSPLGRAWDSMDPKEREFWLRGIGGKFMSEAGKKWANVRLEVKEQIKVILPKVAKRASLIVEGA